MKSRLITCLDFQNLGMWNTHFCCEDCHTKMTADMKNAELIFVSDDISLPYKIADTFIAILVCCKLKEVANFKLTMNDLKLIVEGQKIMDNALEKLLANG